jgi:hypothetical protein
LTCGAASRSTSPVPSWREDQDAQVAVLPLKTHDFHDTTTSASDD